MKLELNYKKEKITKFKITKKMSVREEKILSLTNVDLSKKSTKELKSLFKEVLFDGVHGFC